MRIIREDKHQLIFLVYPTKYFLCFILFVLFILSYVALTPDTTGSLVYHFSAVIFYTAPREVVELISVALRFAAAGFFIVYLMYLILSYAFPIRVVIDKSAGKLTYRTLRPFFTRESEEVKIENIKGLLYNDSIPETDQGFLGRNRRAHIGKFCFLLKDSTVIPFYAGIFSFTRHEAAFKKIAKYLEIPFEKKVSSEMSKEGYAPSWKKVNGMLIIMIILILIVAALIGLASLGRTA